MLKQGERRLRQEGRLMVECWKTLALMAYDCNNQSSMVEQYSLLEPEPCGNMQKVHAIEKDLYSRVQRI